MSASHPSNGCWYPCWSVTIPEIARPSTLSSALKRRGWVIFGSGRDPVWRARWLERAGFGGMLLWQACTNLTAVPGAKMIAAGEVSTAGDV